MYYASLSSQSGNASLVMLTVAMRMSMELVFEFPTVEHLHCEECRDRHCKYHSDTTDNRTQNLGDKDLVIDGDAVSDRSIGIKK